MQMMTFGLWFMLEELSLGGLLGGFVLLHEIKAASLDKLMRFTQPGSALLGWRIMLADVDILRVQRLRFEQFRDGDHVDSAVLERGDDCGYCVDCGLVNVMGEDDGTCRGVDDPGGHSCGVPVLPVQRVDAPEDDGQAGGRQNSVVVGAVRRAHETASIHR